MLRKTETMNLRIDPGVKDALWRLAEHEHRSIANLIEVLIIDKCREAGVEISVENPVQRGARARKRKLSTKE